MFLLWPPLIGTFVPYYAFPLLASTEAFRTGEETDMSDLEQLNRILYQHKWRSLQDWVTTLDELADLSDAEIEEIQQLRVANCDGDPQE
jgi:hypothetical protein